MPDLQELLDHLVAEYVPGAVALVDRDGDVEFAAAGVARADGTPMQRDTIVRAASITKPILGALTMMLVEDGTLRLDAPVGEWLPEIADPTVLRRPDGPVDDVVRADRPITVEDLLTFRGGHGFPSDFSYPVVEKISGDLLQGPPQPQQVPAPDEWMRRVSTVPLLHQPGDGWTYNTGADILGVLLARAAVVGLPELLQQRIFQPLGMVDTGFSVPGDKRDRLADFWVDDESGNRNVDDAANSSAWLDEPPFPSGAGGLVTTVDDWWRFGRMLVGGGELDGVRLLSPASVEAMTTDRLNAEQKQWGELFLDGQGWGYCGSVDRDGPDVWNVAGRFGWVGGTGTSAHVIGSQQRVALLFTQLQVGGPQTGDLLHEFWAYSATD